MQLQSIVVQVAQFYSTLIFVYIIMSWFPVGGVFADLYRVLASLCEPYLRIFRRIIPPIGMIDISPIVAIMVLNWIVRILVGF